MTKRIGMILGIILALVALVVGGWLIRYYTAEPRGIVETEERLQSPESRLSRYQHFFDLCTTAQSQKTSIKAQKNRLKHTSNDDTKDRIHANIAGLKAQLQRTVSRYNNDSQTYTSGQFKDSKLPVRLSTDGETRCTINNQ